MFDFLKSLWQSEPVRLLYVVAIAAQTFATLSLGGEPLEAVLRGVLLAVIGEIQRQRVSPVA